MFRSAMHTFPGTVDKNMPLIEQQIFDVFFL
jgi:hypothetical protein